MTPGTPLANAISGWQWQPQLVGYSVAMHTVLATATAAFIVLAAGMYLRRQVRVMRPGTLQILWETTVEAADRAVPAGPEWARRRIVGLAVTLFWFVLAANWLHLVPVVALPAPTSDINLTAALALVAIVIVHLTAVQVRGLRGYLGHYLSPWWLAPLRLLEELIKPLTLALRLFGMVFASALMLLLIGELLPPPVAVVPHALWTLFDLFIGVIQAYIFAVLTVLYSHIALPAPAAHPSQGVMKPCPQRTTSWSRTRRSASS
jgi:F-type H+-transporting ATPase subunit a